MIVNVALSANDNTITWRRQWKRWSKGQSQQNSGVARGHPTVADTCQNICIYSYIVSFCKQLQTFKTSFEC